MSQQKQLTGIARSRHPGMVGVVALLGAVLCLGETTLAQWSSSGNDIYNSNSGNVGIGTTGPSRLLHLQGSNALGIALVAASGAVADNNWGHLIIGRNSTTAGTEAKLAFAAGASFLDPIASVGGRLESDGQFAGALTFYTRPSSGISGERMRITSAGSVGIGTPTPATPLHVVSGANDVFKIESTSPTSNFIFTTSGGQAGEFTANSGGLQFNAPLSGHGITFLTQGTNPIVFKSGGSVGIGTASPASGYKLHVAGAVKVDGNIASKYQDLAEWVTASQAIAAGTVVVVDGERNNQVVPSARAYDTAVAGVISEAPAILLGEEGEGKVAVATTGRVKVRVQAGKAAIKAGDLLVSSDKEGVAMKSEPVEVAGVRMHRPGTLIGKALESLAEGEGEILVLLSLQ